MDSSLVDIVQPSIRDGHLDRAKLKSLIESKKVSTTSQSISGLLAAVAGHNEWPGLEIGQAIADADTGAVESLDWEAVFALLEQPPSAPPSSSQKNLELRISSPVSLTNVVAAIGGLSGPFTKNNEENKAVATFFGRKWSILQNQVDILVHASDQQKHLNLSVYGLRKVIEASDFAQSPPHVQSIANNLESHPLNYRHLIVLSLDAICREEDPAVASARSFLDRFAKAIPEIFFLGGITIPKPWHPLLDRVIGNFFELFFAGHASRQLVFVQLAKVDKNFFFDSLVEIFERDSGMINHILSLAQDAEILEELLYLNHYNFGLELATQADKQNLVLFDTFLKKSLEKIRAIGSNSSDPPEYPFVISLLDFLEAKATVEYTQPQVAGSPPTGLNLRSVAAALNFVSSVEIPADRIEKLKAIQIQCLQSYPKLINFGQGHDDAILAHGDINSFPPEVEREMKLYYQKMYEQKIEIRDIITMLQRLKKSDDPLDQDVFACMVHSLFDEYRFFPEYPLSALATTAVLFGSLVYFQLIEGLPLSIALRFILESLKQPTDSNMFRFGLQALFEFRQRLHEFPKYCTILLDIPGLVSQQQFYQQIKDIVDRGQNAEVASQNHQLEETELGPGDFRSVSAVVPIDNSHQEEPSEGVSDKVLFIVNNIAQNNVASKSNELASLLERRYYAWFASYIVGQRSKQEPNYHALYIDMLRHIGNRELELHCLKITYFHITQLLNSPDTISSSDKRTQLKNLGHWLGSMTLARDRPILHKNVAFKKLLIEGYDLGKLAVVLPFVCKTLERASSSTVFLPPNPWLMGLMHVLSELYQYAELKLNLKFEIEVLCNQLDLDINTVVASTIVRNRPSETELHDAQSANLAQELDSLRIQGNEHLGPVTGVANLPRPNLNLPNNGNTSNMENELSVYSSIINQLALVGNTGFVTHPTLKQIFSLAIDKSIREVLPHVVERSSTIASLAARELITKDFALEEDEQKLRIAAKNVVRVLAGSISLVTCKEPVRETLVTNLRSMMVSNGYADYTVLLEQVVLAVNDNVDIICSIVEDAAVEKSYAQIEEVLGQAYFSRKRHRESHTNQPFVDPQLNSRYPLQLPDPFRLKPGGLLPQQFAIYENFGKYRPAVEYGVDTRQAPDTRQSIQVQNQSQQTQVLLDESPYPGNASLKGQAVMAPNGTSPALFDQLIMQIQNAIDSLEKLIKESSEVSITQLTPDHRISVLISQILTVTSRSSFRDDIILKTSQMTVSTLFMLTDSQLGREVLCFLLDKLCQMSSATAKEVVLWLIYSDDERKYNVAVMVTLIKAKLITVSEIDANLAKQVLAKIPSAISFAAGLIKEVVLSNDPICLRTDFTGSLEALEVLAKEEPPNSIAVDLLNCLEEAKPKSILKEQQPAEVSEKSDEDNGKDEANKGASAISLKEQMGYIFAEWSRLAQHPSSTERSLHIFVYELSKQGILNDSELLYTLIRSAVEISVDSYKKSTGSEAFLAVDSLAKLFVTIIETSKKMEMSRRVEYAKIITSVILLNLAADHETELENFNGRPYFRLFSTLLYELTELKEDSEEFKHEVHLLIADALNSLQPLAFPGFSFAWMTLISHRFFLPKLMEIPGKKGWAYLANLLGALVKFEGCYIEGKDFPEPIAVMYKGTLRIFLVLLHDHPEFLIENHYSLCNSIPLNFVQLRNLVLSAFPENIQLPDPLTQGLKVDKLPEIKESPILAIDPELDLQKFGLKKLIGAYLKNPSQALAKALAGGFKTKASHEVGLGFNSVSTNYPALNALVLYLGVQAVRSNQETAGSGKIKAKNDKSDKLIGGDDDTAHFNRDSAHLQLLAQLMKELDTEGRYFLCEAIANQLRYPNAHTHFFSCVILSLFGNYGTQALGDDKQTVQHLITRVLLERIICNRPHPWGLMITFTELLKNSNYKFWDLPFTRITPEVSINEKEANSRKGLKNCTNMLIQIERMFASLYSHISNSNSNNSPNTTGVPIVSETIVEG
ncbi:CCR4-NOT core subunit CDC39 [Sugiyamaella lignohabitans]|uniref:General negative regulator of transcription subunit 1 n=1 Tax=Sugiyamaella lignohabitans TaxID=796027 RepID=A0A167FWD5_9ASCO|nr:CCR4-NOT core subunit CDC39 [Sugiyamaella lignohabitans]ANB15785.1 CCR4-NOT core subunit CDC39 [Sugiyamaella lignohabitans]